MEKFLQVFRFSINELPEAFFAEPQLELFWLQSIYFRGGISPVCLECQFFVFWLSDRIGGLSNIYVW